MVRSTRQAVAPRLLRAVLILAVLLLGIANARQQAMTTYDDDDPAIVYSQGHDGDGQNGWATGPDSNDFGGGEHYTNAYTGSFVVHWTGTDFQWIGKRGPNLGIAYLFLDSQSVGTVDAYNPTPLYQQVLYSVNGLSDGAHVFQMKIGDYPSPAKNPASSNWYQVMDGFATSGTPLSLSMLSPADASVTKSGTWSFGHNILSGQYTWSNDRSTPASLTLPFNGSGVEIYGHPEGEDGFTDVYVDGSYWTTFDEFNPMYDSIMSDSTNDTLFYAVTGLAAGDHTLQLVVSQNHNPNSLDYYTQIDGFIILPGGSSPPPPPPPPPPPSPTGAATFVTADGSTQGTWQGTYGLDGYDVVNDAASYPAYASVSLSNQLYYTWDNSTSDPRALQKVTEASRIAACWTQNGSFSLDMNLTDGAVHRIALYALDWDFGDRSQTVDVLDAGTGQVLDSRSLSNFSGGVYLVWDIQGHVVLNVTWTGGYNAVISGLFFGVADNTTPPPPSGNGTGLTAEYFGSMDLSNPLLIRTDPTIDFNWSGTSPDPGVPSVQYSVRWSGQVLPLYSETYTFTFTADDGVRVWVNGQALIDAWFDQSATAWSGSIDLLAGQAVDIRVEYYQNQGDAIARLEWESASQSRQVVPQSQLFPAASDPSGQMLAALPNHLSSGGGACGLTGLETILVLGLLALRRRR
jgi:hypothetical protein